jgi:hypothetical protein
MTPVKTQLRGSSEATPTKTEGYKPHKCDIEVGRGGQPVLPLNRDHRHTEGVRRGCRPIWRDRLPVTLSNRPLVQ